MTEIAAACPLLAGEAKRRAKAALDLLNLPVESMDVAEARARFSAMLAA